MMFRYIFHLFLILLNIISSIISINIQHNTTLYTLQTELLTHGMSNACNNQKCIFEDVIISLRVDPKFLDVYRSNPAISKNGNPKFIKMNVLYPKKNCLIYGLGHSIADDYDCTFESYLLKSCNNVYSFDCSVQDVTTSISNKSIKRSNNNNNNNNNNNKTVKTTKVADMSKACDDGVVVRSNHCIAAKSRSRMEIRNQNDNEQLFQNKEIFNNIKSISTDNTSKHVDTNTKNKQIIKYETLRDTMMRNNHSSLSLLKIDLEGGEFALFNTVIKTTPYSLLPKQIIVEMHTQFMNNNVQSTPKSLISTKKKHSVNRLFLMLYNVGYRVIDKVLHENDAGSAEFSLFLLDPDDAKKYKSQYFR